MTKSAEALLIRAIDPALSFPPIEPHLELDLDVLAENVGCIMGLAEDQGLSWRPHVKSHLSPALCRYLLARGAIGVTCANTSQASQLVAHGIGEVLVAGPPGSISEWQLLGQMHGKGKIVVVVDSSAHLVMARAAGITDLQVLVEVDLGLGRTGARSVAEAVHLAKQIEASSELSLRGFMGYEGKIFRTWPRSRKQNEYDESMLRLEETVVLARASGLAFDLVTGGGTGSIELKASQALTETQAGGGIFMDETYLNDFHVDRLTQALTVHATVVSQHGPETATINAGFKHFGSSRRPPKALLSGVKSITQSAHLSTISLDTSLETAELKVGSRVALVPGYSDAIIANFSEIWVRHHGAILGSIPTGYNLAASSTPLQN